MSADGTSPKVITIRRAGQADASNLFKMRHKLMEEVGMAAFAPIDDHKLMSWVVHIISRGFVVVADIDGRLVGSVAVHPVVMPWSVRPVLETAWFYVMPQFRDRETPENLLKAVEDHAAEFDLPLVVNVQNTVKAELVDRFVKQRRYDYIGGTFLKMRKGA